MYNRDKQKQKKIKSYNISFDNSKVEPKEKNRRKLRKSLEFTDEMVSNIMEEEIETIDWSG